MELSTNIEFALISLALVNVRKLMSDLKVAALLVHDDSNQDEIQCLHEIYRELTKRATVLLEDHEDQTAADASIKKNWQAINLAQLVNQKEDFIGGQLRDLNQKPSRTTTIMNITLLSLDKMFLVIGKDFDCGSHIDHIATGPSIDWPENGIMFYGYGRAHFEIIKPKEAIPNEEK